MDLKVISGFVVRWFNKSGREILCTMIKLMEILEEIGEGSSKAFEFKEGGMRAGLSREGGFADEIAG